MNEELVKMVLEECRRRCNMHNQQSKTSISCEDKIANLWARLSYSNVICMLEYALSGDLDSLRLFMTEEEPE